MKLFHCDHCGQLVFFENIQCLNCGHALAYLPDLVDIGSLEPLGENTWRSPAPTAQGRAYRLCLNYTRENVCNWAVPADDPHPLCASCRLTRVIPDLSQPGHKEAWYRLEVAKRRLVYSVFMLGLPLFSKADDPENGLAYDFLAETGTTGGTKVLTGHSDGVITVNVAEADDAERERRRLQLGEPYRTLLGHFRHEIGHYYWDRLIHDSTAIESYRRLFGDERRSYAEALQNHYNEGPRQDWPNCFISAYASSHPWEDWAETWAHYLHMSDALETAAECGLSLKPKRLDAPALEPEVNRKGGYSLAFDKMVENWFPLTFVLNSLNRGLGLPDGYPFVLSEPVIEKLRFVHEMITTAAKSATESSLAETAPA